MSDKKVALLILDGWGIGKKDDSDGVFLAETPYMDSLYKNYPHSQLLTHGENVGLPEGQMGNSEVGHMNIGAGRVVDQDLVRINKEITEGIFRTNTTILNAIHFALKNNSSIHLMGLVSEGGVHSSQQHLYAFAKLLKDEKFPTQRAFIHAFTDGRDCDPKSGIEYIQQLEETIKDTPLQIASVIGRYFAMDRDRRWERIKKAYDLMVSGIGASFQSASQAIKVNYDNGITDEFINPSVITGTDGIPLSKIEENDVVICFNFRTDRCRQITEVLTQQNHAEDDMYKMNLHYVTMTNYDKSFKNIHVIYEKDELSNTLGEIISKANKTQLRIAETEKYPHVSFFFNGGREAPFSGEKRIMVDSPKVATYDLQPEMSAHEITREVCDNMKLESPDFICLNFANGDMVGHTGVKEAIIQACETVDNCLEKVITTAIEKKYSVIVIADHGNADLIVNTDGTVNTAHSLNPVPCIIVDQDFSSIKNGILADIAPTVLDLLNIPVPIEMKGTSLLK